MQEAGQKLSHREKTDMKRALKLRVKQLKTTRWAAAVVALILLYVASGYEACHVLAF